MKLYSVVEPHRLDPGIAVEIIFTENDILDLYWQYWKEKMEKVGKEKFITKEKCIQDWVVVNWAAVCEDYDIGYGVVRMDYDMWKDYDKRMQSYDK